MGLVAKKYNTFQTKSSYSTKKNSIESLFLDIDQITIVDSLNLQHSKNRCLLIPDTPDSTLKATETLFRSNIIVNNVGIQSYET